MEYRSCHTVIELAILELNSKISIVLCTQLPALYYLCIQNSINWFPTLKIGTHEYLGETIDTVPIRTTSALCYKVKPLNLKFGKSILFQIFVSDNSLEKINLYVAANNTWQGVIYGKWPKKAKSPVKIVGEISQKSINQYTASLELSDWSYLEGNANYSECLSDKEMYGTGCISMFHPDSYKFENRYALIVNSIDC